MSRALLATCIALFLLPAWASEPGEPVDCDDWVFLEAGLSCDTYNPHPADTGLRVGGTALVLDNEGNPYASKFIHGVGTCGAVRLDRLEIVRFNGSNETTIAFIEDKCFNPALNQADQVSFPDALRALVFVRNSGSMLVALHTRCRGPSGTINPDFPDAPCVSMHWIRR